MRRTADKELRGSESSIETNGSVVRLKNRRRSGRSSTKNASNARDEGHCRNLGMILIWVLEDPQNPSKTLDRTGRLELGMRNV